MAVGVGRAPECGHVHAAEPRDPLLAEVGGAVPFDGEVEATGLLGAVFPLTREFEVRVAWTRGLAGEVEGDSGVVVGMVVHF